MQFLKIGTQTLFSPVEVFHPRIKNLYLTLFPLDKDTFYSSN